MRAPLKEGQCKHTAENAAEVLYVFVPILLPFSRKNSKADLIVCVVLQSIANTHANSIQGVFFEVHSTNTRRSAALPDGIPITVARPRRTRDPRQTHPRRPVHIWPAARLPWLRLDRQLL